MKKSLILAVLGVAVTAATSFGQGHVYFANYAPAGTGGTSDPGVDALVTYASSQVPAGKESLAVGSGFSAELFYSIGGGTPTTALTSSIQPFFATDGDTGNGAGYFVFGAIDIPGYTSGVISFQVDVFNTVTIGGYAPGAITGQSQVLTAAGISTGLALGNSLGYNLTSGTFAPFTVSATVPEPSTLALAGLGLAALVAYRRKQA